jgi:hypothetical protein
VRNVVQLSEIVTHYYYYLIKPQIGFYPVAVDYNKTQHISYKVTHDARTEQSTQATQTMKDIGTLRDRALLGRLGVGGRMILRWATKNQDGRVSQGWVQLSVCKKRAQAREYLPTAVHSRESWQATALYELTEDMEREDSTNSMV